jgi:hypothetical protein
MLKSKAYALVKQKAGAPSPFNYLHKAAHLGIFAPQLTKK